MFDRLFKWLIELEGGFVDHPDDPGGATKYGITKRVAKLFRKDVREITLNDAKRIYRELYYKNYGIDRLPDPWKVAAFLTGVLVGPGRAIRRMQKILGLKTDGIIGPVTIETARNNLDKIPDFLIYNLNLFRRLRHWKTFGRGWTNRMIKTAYYSGVVSDER